MCLFIPATLHPTNTNQAAKQYTDSTDVEIKYAPLCVMQVAEIKNDASCSENYFKKWFLYTVIKFTIMPSHNSF